MSTLSRLELRQHILRLNRLDPVRADYAHLKRTYASIVDGIRLVVGKTLSTETLFRARVERTQPFTHVHELESPPAERVTGYQRCNGPGEPMFYASSKRMTALHEVRSQIGDIVYLSQWMVKEPIPVNRIFEADQLSDLPGGLTDYEESVFSHFDTLFTRRIHDTFSDDYKFTSAITDAITKNFTPHPSEDIREDRTVGIRYPSVVDIGGGYNTALDPAFIGARVNILHVMKLRVDAVAGNEMSCHVLDNAHTFTDGRINWTSDPTAIPAIRPPNAVGFMFDGQKWNLQLHVGEPSAEDLRRLLSE